MLNHNPKHYFNQVAMIESQYESKRKNLASNSSLLLNRSPIRERENTNTINNNTPSRGNPKISLSPLRSRRNDQSISSVRSTAISRRKGGDCPSQYCCKNHQSKTASFMIDKDNECFYFCEKCAITLITNGFQLTKIKEAESMENPRITEINAFLAQLDQVDSFLGRKLKGVQQVVSKGEGAFQEELEKVEQYYEQFYEIIHQHKRRVVDEMKAEFEHSSQVAIAERDRLDEAIQNSANMREDIQSSMNSVILEVLDREFRSVMDQYYDNLDSFKQLSTKPTSDQVKVKSLRFRDGEAVCQALIDGLVIEWDEDAEQSRPPPQDTERENPIECLQNEEKAKSNLKELGGLFCSFDQ